MTTITSALPWPANRVQRWRCALLVALLGAGLIYSFWIDKPDWTDIALMLVLWVAALLTAPEGWPSFPGEMLMPIAAFVATNGVAAAFSQIPYLSGRALIGMAAYLAILILAGNVIHAFGHRLVFRSMALTSGLLLFILVTVWFGDGARLTGYRLSIETNNSLAIYSLLLLPALAVGELHGLVVGGTLFVVWFSGSRGGLVGLIGGLLVLGEALARRAGGLLAWLGRHWRLSAALGLAAGLLLVYEFALPHGDRASLWIISWEMFLDRPLVGEGLNTFKYFWLMAFPGFPSYGHAHNLLLNWLAESGLLGLGAGVWMLAAGGHALLMARRAGNRWAPGVIAAAVALGLQSMVDVPTSQPYIAVAALVLLQLALIPEDTNDGLHTTL